MNLVVRLLTFDDFFRGFLVGQLVFLLVLFFFARYFLMASPSSYVLVRPRKSRKVPVQTADVSKTVASIDVILDKLGLSSLVDVNESCGWLNLLIARLIFAQFHEDPAIISSAVEILEETVAKATKYVQGFSVKECELAAEGVPRIEGFRLKKFYGAAKTLEGSPSTYCLEGRLQWCNIGHFGIEAAAALNWPGDAPLVLLPCSVSVKMLSLDATVRLAFPDNLSNQLELSLVPEQYSLEMEIESSIGHRSQLKNVEKISQLIASLIRQALEDNLVWPNRIPLEIPKFSEMLKQT